MDKIINLLINNWTKGVDTYTHNGSTWLIFTEQRSWVIELTQDKTLWYNYNFFRELFSLTSMDVVENQHYITKWVEDNIINGVKRTMSETIPDSFLIEDTIQNGVKRTKDNPFSMITNVENTIQNGVKSTNMVHMKTCWSVNDTIENGVKHTEYGDWLDGDERLDDIVENGVKETKGHGFEQQNIIDDIVKDGVKETKTPGKDGDIMSTIEWMEENKSTSYTKMIDDVLDNGVKETKSMGKESPNYPRPVINHIIKNGEKINATYVGGNRQKENIESVIGYGTKNPSV